MYSRSHETCCCRCCFLLPLPLHLIGCRECPHTGQPAMHMSGTCRVQSRPPLQRKTFKNVPLKH